MYNTTQDYKDKILKKIGTENPFRVPDGYFENLTSVAA